MKHSNKDLVSDELFDLLDKMLTIDHTRRITTKDAIDHPFFNDVRKAISEIEQQK